MVVTGIGGEGGELAVAACASAQPGASTVNWEVPQVQRILDPPAVVEGIRVAGIGGLLATKLKVIGDRGGEGRLQPA